jgi:hypothetical protein
MAWLSFFSQQASQYIVFLIYFGTESRTSLAERGQAPFAGQYENKAGLAHTLCHCERSEAIQKCRQWKDWIATPPAEARMTMCVSPIK